MIGDQKSVQDSANGKQARFEIDGDTIKSQLDATEFSATRETVLKAICSIKDDNVEKVFKFDVTLKYSAPARQATEETGFLQKDKIPTDIPFNAKGDDLNFDVRILNAQTDEKLEVYVKCGDQEAAGGMRNDESEALEGEMFSFDELASFCKPDFLGTKGDAAVATKLCFKTTNALSKEDMRKDPECVTLRFLPPKASDARDDCTPMTLGTEYDGSKAEVPTTTDGSLKIDKSNQNRNFENVRLKLNQDGANADEI